MGHALANTVLQFGIARFFLGLGESGNFPAAIKTVAEWFPQKRALAGHRHLQLRRQCRRHSCPAHRALDHRCTTAGTRPSSSPASSAPSWICCGSTSTASPPTTPRSPAPSCAYINQEAAARLGPSTPWIKLLGYRQTWAFAIAKFLTDPIWWFYLYWLPSLLQRQIPSRSVALGLPLIIVYNASAVGSIGGGWLPAPFMRLGLHRQRARLAAMLFCACLVVPVFLINYLHRQLGSGRPSACSASPRQPTRAGRPISSPPPRICFRAAPSARSPASAAWPAQSAALCSPPLPATFSADARSTRSSSSSPPAFICSRCSSCVLLAPGLKKVESAA